MLRVELKRSRLLTAVLASAHAGAAAVMAAVDLPVYVSALLAVALVVSAARTVRVHALLAAPKSIVAVELHDDGRVAVRTPDGNWCDARLLGTTCVSPPLTVLNLKHPGSLRPRHVVLLPDSAHPDDLRRLRVILRWKYPPLVAGADPRPDVRPPPL